VHEDARIDRLVRQLRKLEDVVEIGLFGRAHDAFGAMAAHLVGDENDGGRPRAEREGYEYGEWSSDACEALRTGLARREDNPNRRIRPEARGDFPRDFYGRSRCALVPAATPTP
jgi:hypothetical protein